MVQLTKRQLITYLTVAAILGGIAGGVICDRLAATRTDEPPIRVRGGSMSLLLHSATEKFKAQGNHWEVTGPNRHREEFFLYLDALDPANCSGKYEVDNIKDIEFVHRSESREDVTIRVHAPGKKTKVYGPLRLINSDRELVYEVDGFIAQIKLDNKVVCTFNDSTDLRFVWVGP